MSSAPDLTLLYGGTFDPVHHGHLFCARELARRLSPCQLYLVPAADPPHRAAPGADAGQRVAMLRLALEEAPELLLDERELRRDGPSYSVDTLEQWRGELGDGAPLVWVMGSDAWASFGCWRRWRRILELAHVLVLARPGNELSQAGLEADLLAQQGIDDPGELRRRPAGGILNLKLPLRSESATAIRRRLQAGQAAGADVPAAVAEYIRKHDLYQNPGRDLPANE